MGFRDNFPGVLERSLTQLGALGNYVSVALDEIENITIFLERDSVLQPSSMNAQVVEVGITIEALISEVGRPERGAEFTLNDETFTVQRIETDDGTIVRMWVTENES